MTDVVVAEIIWKVLHQSWCLFFSLFVSSLVQFAAWRCGRFLGIMGDKCWGEEASIQSSLLLLLWNQKACYRQWVWYQCSQTESFLNLSDDAVQLMSNWFHSGGPWFKFECSFKGCIVRMRCQGGPSRGKQLRLWFADIFPNWWVGAEGLISM